jgi:hypothetical protein
MRIPSFIAKLITDYFRFVAAGVILIIFVAGFVLLIQAKVDTLRTSGYLERAKVESDLATEREYLRRLTASIEKFRRVLPDEKLEAVDQFIPTGADFPRLALTIRNIAAAANLNLATIAVNETDAVATAPVEDQAAAGDGGAGAQAATISGVALRTQDVAISVTNGENYENFKRFIALLESSQRLLDVISVSFSHQDQANAADSSYDIILRSYYLPPT